MREMRIECFRAGESTLSYCLPQVLRITCSGVLRTLICSYLDTGKKRCLKIGKSHKMKKTCVFLGSWILSPVMQCDQRHPLFLGGDGRAAQRFKQMIESLNHRTQREHSLSEEPLLCANRPAMQCIVGPCGRPQHMNSHHAKRTLKESMGYKVLPSSWRSPYAYPRR